MNSKISPASLEKALADNQLLFFYQPVVSLFTGKICGAESLIRWKQPDGSIISPDLFIPLAEKTGFITEITEAMLPKVVNDLAALNLVDDSLFVSFNVSPKDFHNKNFLKNLSQSTSGKLRKLENLYIEITESSFLVNDSDIQRTLHDIDSQGVSILLNDFSAGYTTLSTLTQLPLKAIKLAMDIVQRAPTTRSDFRLFRHLVSMAHQLHLDVIAEGVENQETHTLILATGCTHSQGYFYGHPMPLADFVELLAKKPHRLEYPFGLEYLAQLDLVDFHRDILKSTMMIYTTQDKEIRERVLARLPEIEREKGLVGEWYASIEYRYKGKKSYKQLGVELKQYHDLAKSLLEDVLLGENWGQLSRTIALFSKKSIAIMDLIHSIEIKELKSHFKIR